MTNSICLKLALFSYDVSSHTESWSGCWTCYVYLYYIFIAHKSWLPWNHSVCFPWHCSNTIQKLIWLLGMYCCWCDMFYCAQTLIIGRSYCMFSVALFHCHKTCRLENSLNRFGTKLDCDINVVWLRSAPVSFDSIMHVNLYSDYHGPKSYIKVHCSWCWFLLTPALGT